MSFARVAAVIAALGLAALGLELWRSPRSEQAAPPRLPVDEAEEPGLEIHGFVQSRRLDMQHWTVRGLPLRYEARDSIARSEINSRGHFRLTGLAPGDYRVELVTDGAEPLVLASADFVRPGGEELVLEVDLLQLLRLEEAERAGK